MWLSDKKYCYFKKESTFMTQNYAQPNHMAVNNALSNSSTFKYIRASLEFKNDYLLKSLQNVEVTL